MTLKENNMDKKQIISLDLGTEMGWASIDETGSINSGTINFKNDRFSGGGMRFLKFKRWLTEMKNSTENLECIVFEEVRARQPSVAADQTYGGFMATLTAWCEHHVIPYEGIPVKTIKKFLTGTGNANKGQMIEGVRAKGFNPADDNEADAIAMLLFSQSTL